MDRYGIDKPDLRYELPIVDVSDIVRESGFQVFAAPSPAAAWFEACARQARRASRAGRSTS